jgi:hypothetical protein
MKRLLFLLLLLSSYQVISQNQNVLFIGNSYTHYNNMPKIFERIAKANNHVVYADSIAVSGSTLKQHAERPTTYAKMKKKPWNIVVIQGFSREFAQDSSVIMTETMPYVRQLIDSVLTFSPCAQIYFYMTWGYKDGFADEEANNTYDKMQARILYGYKLLQHEFGYPIVPVGLVWKDLRENYPEINLYEDDNQHPNFNGSYTIATTFYSAFYNKTSNGEYSPVKLNQNWKTTLIGTASKIIRDNCSYFKLDSLTHPTPVVPPIMDFSIREHWTNISIQNRTKYYNSIQWDFGDGSVSKKYHPKHYYQKNGTYTVTLTVVRDCHEFILTKKITVSHSDKYATSNPKKKKS